MWIYRIKYSKQGVTRFISHLDTMRAIKRALSRADIPVAYSEGFNPRPKISMGPPLALGCESRCEWADIVLTRPIAPDKLRLKLDNAMPEGLDLLEIDRVHGASPKLSGASCISYMVELPLGETIESAPLNIRRFLDKESAPLDRVRKNKKTTVDVRSFVLGASVGAGADFDGLNVDISMSERGTCSPSEVLQAVFGISPDDAKCLRVVRTDIRFDDTPAKR